MNFHCFDIISSLKSVWSIIWAIFNTLFQIIALYQVLLKLDWPNASFFKFLYFRYFSIIPPSKRGPFIWTNLNPLHLRMLCAKCSWNWNCGSGEENLNFVKIFLVLWSPLGKGRGLHLKILEFASPKDALYKGWLKLAYWFWRRSKNEVFWRRRRQTTEELWSEKHTWAFGSGEL